MEFALNAILTIKNKDRYIKKSVRSHLKLRGNHYKINQEIQLTINFEDTLLVKAGAYIYSNKFTSVPHGKVSLKEVSFRG